MDVDDVLFPLVPHLTDFVNDRLGTSFRVADYHTYDFSEAWGTSRFEAVDLVEEYLASHPLSVAPIPGAALAVRSLAEDWRLVVVTSRVSAVQERTEEWIGAHFQGCFDDIVFTGNHWRGLACKSKGEACRALGARYLIDDLDLHVNSAQDHGINTILFGRYPWNATAFGADSAVASDWGEVRRYLDVHARQVGAITSCS